MWLTMPELLRLLEGDQAAGDHQLDGAGLADEAGEALGAAGAGEHAEGDLGQADLAGAFLAIRMSAAMAISRPPPTVCPSSAAMHQLGRLLQAVQRLVGVQAEVVLEVGVRRP